MRGSKVILSKEEIKFIRANLSTMTNKQLADKLGMKVTTLRVNMYSLGLKRIELEYWTEEQVQLLRNNYHYIGDKEMAEIFNENFYKEKGWKRGQIEKKRRYLKLNRTMEMQSAIRERAIQNGTYILGVKKMWGVRGANPVGTIVQWAEHTFIKCENGKYELYNRYLWKKHNGAIPHKMNVIKINPLKEWTIENMTLATDAELAMKNAAAFHAYPDDLKKVIKIKNQLTKKISNHGENKF